MHYYNNICDIRTQRGLTQADLATAMERSERTIRRWEQGQTSPSIKDINALADALGVTVGELGYKYLHNDSITADDVRTILQDFGEKDLITIKKFLQQIIELI